LNGSSFGEKPQLKKTRHYKTKFKTGAGHKLHVPRFFLLHRNLKKGARPTPKRPHDHLAVKSRTTAVVVMIVPVAIVVPAMAVLIPPAMAFVPASFAGFVQFMPRMLGLPAVPAVVFRSFMQLVVCLGNAPLASVVTFG
jgi:hypothetical protein